MFAAATAKEFQTLLLSRFFAGVFVSCPLAVVGGAFSDLFGNETRGIAITFFSALVFIGPFISPIVGAFITQSHLGWRWTVYIAGIMGGLACILDVLGETQNFAIHHVSEEENIDSKDLVEKHLLLPLKPLFLVPIVLLITIYTAFIYGILYLFLEAYPIVLAELRGINMAVATLPYIELILGVCIRCGIVIYFEPRYNKKLEENNNISVPEQRLSPMMIGTVLALNYLIDAYLMVAASATAANTFLRSFFRAGFPLFATGMFHSLGVAWAGSLLGFLAIAFLPIPFLFYTFGERLRKLSKHAPTEFASKPQNDEESKSE
ncbi:hypothetical protein OEA41_004959 [Lepraria neglecta]|uniref:Major facilitator superfamily (MFS) profile domain-containing protein n=1 Tax=Lepraria neglecta TaxID=209136 RepID=A0AAD9YYX5_9LECA|nr:hypothetical protein OEA41_004959 [Lepraria neglecta]